MQAKEMFLKQISRKSLILVLLLGALICEQVVAKDLILKRNSLNDYIKKSNEFSSQFIQASNESLSDGFLYLDRERIKIEYINPSKITIILTKSKAMYFNHDLNEVEYFNPTKTIGNIFYQIFYDNNFFNKTQLMIQTNSITAIKNIKNIVFSILNINHNPNFDKKFFSMTDPRSN